MDISSLLPLLMSGGGGKNNNMSAIAQALAMQNGGGSNDTMSQLLKAMSGNSQESPTPPQRNDIPAQQEPLYDTNPQYLTSYYSGEPKETKKQSAKLSPKEELEQMNRTYGKTHEKDTNTAPPPTNSGSNMQAQLLASMMGGGKPDPMQLMQMMGGGGDNGGGINPLLLMTLMNQNKKSDAPVSAAAVNANLTKPIEPFAPSQIVLNIRKMMSK